MIDEKAEISACLSVLGDVVDILQKVKGVKNVDIQQHGVSSSQLSQIKAGTKLPSLEKLFELSKGLNVPVSVIIGLVEDQQKHKHSKIEQMRRVCERIHKLEAEIEHDEQEYRELSSRTNEAP